MKVNARFVVPKQQQMDAQQNNQSFFAALRVDRLLCDSKIQPPNRPKTAKSPNQCF